MGRRSFSILTCAMSIQRFSVFIHRARIVYCSMVPFTTPNPIVSYMSYDPIRNHRSDRDFGY